MARTPAQAMDYANTITSGYGGKCLQFVRICFDIPAKYGTAREARQNCKSFHPTTDPMSVPAGYPVWMGDNHIAISMGNGMMRTTNSATNKVSTVPISSWGKSYPLKGWGQDLNGVSIPGSQTDSASPPVGSLTVDGLFGTTTVKRWQQVMGMVADGIISGQYSGNKQYHQASAAIQYGSGGSSLVRAVQTKLGVTVDGQLGPNTIKAIQRHLGVTADGYFAAKPSETVKALQGRLNTGMF